LLLGLQAESVVAGFTCLDCVDALLSSGAAPDAWQPNCQAEPTHPWLA